MVSIRTRTRMARDSIPKGIRISERRKERVYLRRNTAARLTVGRKSGVHVRTFTQPSSFQVTNLSPVPGDQWQHRCGRRTRVRRGWRSLRMERSFCWRERVTCLEYPRIPGRRTRRTRRTNGDSVVKQLFKINLTGAGDAGAMDGKTAATRFRTRSLQRPNPGKA